MPLKNTEESCNRSPRRGYPTEDTFEAQGAPVTDEQDAYAGVKKVEAALRIYGRYSRWCLFIGCAHFLTTVETHWHLLLFLSPSLVNTASSDFAPLRCLVSRLHRTFTLSTRRPPMHTSLLRPLASESTAS